MKTTKYLLLFFLCLLFKLNLKAQVFIGIDKSNLFGFQLQTNVVELFLPSTENRLLSATVRKIYYERRTNIRTNVGFAIGYAKSRFDYKKSNNNDNSLNNEYILPSENKYLKTFKGDGKISYSCIYTEFYAKRFSSTKTGFNSGVYTGFKTGIGIINAGFEQGFVFEAYDSLDFFSNPAEFKKYKVSEVNNKLSLQLYFGLEYGKVIPLNPRKADNLFLDVSACVNLHINYKEPLNVVEIEHFLKYKTSARLRDSNIATLNIGINYAF